MNAVYYDIVVVGDFRYPGGTSTAIAEELLAQSAAGYRTGLIALKGPVLRFPHPFHPKIRAAIDDGLVDWLDPAMRVRAGLAIAHHPGLFTLPPRRGLALEADARLLIAHHPPADAAGEAAYDVLEVDAHLQDMLGGPVTWAPIGPVVRAQLAALEPGPALLEQDWHNVLDVEPWGAPRAEFCGRRLVIGRHSRPDPLKWPDDRARILQVYPDDPELQVKILGGGAFLHALVGPYPRNWQVWPFNAMPPERFLQQLDLFVYYHHSRWVEAFGRTILEAMASGAPAILPPAMAPLFGDAARYAEPAGAVELARALHGDLRAFREQSARGHAAVRERFSHAVHQARLRALIGAPHQAVPPAASRPRARPRRVLLITSNGVGMGHLTRMLAVARRCPAPIEPVFLTMSQAVKVVSDQGYLAEFLPFHAYLQCDQVRWNQFLAEELGEIFGFYDPAVVLFDGNVPYQGLIEAIQAWRDPWYVWCRRGLWRPGAGLDVIEREVHFDAVIEPGDLAASYDHGVTARYRSRTRAVAPIRLLDDHELLPRDAARAELGLDLGRPAALILLGAGNNFDFEALRRSAMTRLEERHDAQICLAEWLIKDQAEAEPAASNGAKRLATFPFSRYFNAFDLAISAAGYNSFHELIFARIPTIFVPNEHPHTDDQLARARYAERHGLGVCVRVDDIYRLGPAIDQLLDPAEPPPGRRSLLDPDNGALQAARIIEEMVYSQRVDRR
jgi:hypothetical protein